MFAYLNGLALGFSLIMALGPQNVFLIRQGVKRQHAVVSAFICFCCDVILVSISIMGLHHVLFANPYLQTWLSLFGALFLLYYGASSLKSGLNTENANSVVLKETTNRFQVIMLALGFSLLNPHAIIDTLIIIGGGSSQFPEQEYIFLLGVITSSLLWFTSITFTTRYFSEILGQTVIWRRFELASGLLMLFLSIKLISNQLI